MGSSWMPDAPGRPNLLGISSPALGVVSVALAVALSVALPAADRLPVATVPVRQGGRLVERDLEGFLRATGTTAFLVVKGDTLVSEAYFHGYGHDSTVSSFSVAKPVVSTLVGIAIGEEGRIGSVDDPVTRYLPALTRRDPRFGRITLRHLLRHDAPG